MTGNVIIKAAIAFVNTKTNFLDMNACIGTTMEAEKESITTAAEPIVPLSIFIATFDEKMFLLLE